MYAFNIVIKNRNPNYQDEFVSDCSSYAYFLSRNGQILKNNHQIIINGNVIKIPVLCPEKSAMHIKNSSSYCHDVLAKIEENTKSKIEYIATGVDESDYPVREIPTESNFYILNCGSSSPLLCGDTEYPIPLYKIPYTAHNGMDFDDITFWENDFDRLFGLWLGDYEPFAKDELQNFDSKINKRGRKICAKIEFLTGVPTYYFLFNDRNWSLKDDLNRKCPLTGNDWLIKDRTANDLIAFKCEESRLVSNLSHSCISESI